MHLSHDKHNKNLHRPPDDAVWFVALGGLGEFGMNLALYGTAGKWLMVDCGIMFGDETTPGVEVIVPDIAFITERREDLLGIVLTHAHEDHLGAVEHLWPHLKCPVYATPFTSGVLRRKLSRAGLEGKVKVMEIPSGGSFELGPFRGEMIPVTHSIAEAQMLALRTRHGAVLHTGDWKLDPTPVIGGVTDEERLKELGRDGQLMALVGDSTNALVPGRIGSELDVQQTYERLFSQIRQRVVVACFSSNIARLKSVATVAKKVKRDVTLVGRSMWRNAEVAEECGYLPEYNEFLSENEAMLTPRDRIVMVCTGCQGEPRAALWRIATDDHPEVELDEGDTVIFSSREIPGNEKTINRLQNRLIAQGIKVITVHDEKVHVSGHAAREEMVQLYQWTRPRLAVPVHGEVRQRVAHEQIAKECQIPHTILPANGQIVRLGPGLHEIVGEVKSGQLALDGKVLRRLDHDATRLRRKMNANGVAAITLVMDRRGVVVQEPQVSLVGLVEDIAESLAAEGAEMSQLPARIADVTLDSIEQMPKSTRLDDNAVRHAVAQATRRKVMNVCGKKPLVEVHVVRV
ncbi:MAG: ribonuclease J [Bdellovibrionales bacterium]